MAECTDRLVEGICGRKDTNEWHAHWHEINSIGLYFESAIISLSHNLLSSVNLIYEKKTDYQY